MARNEDSWLATKTIRYPNLTPSYRQTYWNDAGYGSNAAPGNERQFDGYGSTAEPRNERQFDAMDQVQRGAKRPSDYNTSSSNYKMQRTDEGRSASYSSTTGPNDDYSINQQGYLPVIDQGSGDSKSYYELPRKYDRPDYGKEADLFNPQPRSSLNSANAEIDFGLSSSTVAQGGYPMPALEKGETRKINYDEGIRDSGGYFQNWSGSNNDSKDKSYKYDDFDKRSESSYSQKTRDQSPSRAYSPYANDKTYSSQLDVFSRRQKTDGCGGNDSSQRYGDRKSETRSEKYHSISESRRVGLDRSEFERKDDSGFQMGQSSTGLFPNRDPVGQVKNEREFRPDFDRQEGYKSNSEFQKDKFNKDPLTSRSGQVRNELNFSHTQDHQKDFRESEFRSVRSPPRRSDVNNFKNQFESRGYDFNCRDGYKSRDDRTNNRNILLGAQDRRAAEGGKHRNEPELGANHSENLREPGFHGDRGDMGSPSLKKGFKDQFMNEPDLLIGSVRERGFQNQQREGPAIKCTTDDRFINESDFQRNSNYQRDFRGTRFEDKRIIGIAPTVSVDRDQYRNEDDFRRENSFQQKGFGNSDFQKDMYGQNPSDFQLNNRFRDELNQQRGDFIRKRDDFFDLELKRMGVDNQSGFNPEFRRQNYDGSDRQIDFSQSKDNNNRFDNKRGDLYRQGGSNQLQNFHEFDLKYSSDKQWNRNSSSDKRFDSGIQKFSDSHTGPLNDQRIGFKNLSGPSGGRSSEFTKPSYDKPRDFNRPDQSSNRNTQSPPRTTSEKCGDKYLKKTAIQKFVMNFTNKRNNKAEILETKPANKPNEKTAETIPSKPMPKKNIGGKPTVSTSKPEPVKDVKESTSKPEPVKNVKESTSKPEPVKDMKSSTSKLEPVKDIKSSTSKPEPVKDIKESTSNPEPVKDTKAAPAKVIKKINKPLAPFKSGASGGPCTPLYGDLTVEKIANMNGPLGRNKVFLCKASEPAFDILENNSIMSNVALLFKNDYVAGKWIARILMNGVEISSCEQHKKNEAKLKAYNSAMSTLRRYYYFIKIKKESNNGGCVMNPSGALDRVSLKKPRVHQILKVENMKKVKESIMRYISTDTIRDLEFGFELTVDDCNEITQYATGRHLVVKKLPPSAKNVFVLTKRLNIDIWEILRNLIKGENEYNEVYELVPPGGGHLF